MTKEELAHWVDEHDKCKDLIYFYENYYLIKVDGKDVKPKPLTEVEKMNIRMLFNFQE